MSKKLLTCPDCKSEEVTLSEEISYMANSGDFYCKSVKLYDSDSNAECLKCGWTGKHFEMSGYGVDK